jgi:hypothetical protein
MSKEESNPSLKLRGVEIRYHRIVELHRLGEFSHGADNLFFCDPRG